MYSLVFFVPETHLEIVKDALFDKGAGMYRAYDKCSWEVRGTGQFRPVEGSNPFIGKQGNIERVDEFRVEMICEDHNILSAVEALLEAHPYEEPAYHISRIFTVDDLPL